MSTLDVLACIAGAAWLYWSVPRASRLGDRAGKWCYERVLKLLSGETPKR